MNFLVVDDSPLTVSHLKALLGELGHTVLAVANTGEAGLAAYHAATPDIVTMDITMPGMDGVETTRRILADFPDAAVIMVTSYGQEKMIMDAMAAGAMGYLMKPLNRDKLAALIATVAGRTGQR